MKRSLHVVALAVLAFLLLGPIPKSLARTPVPPVKAAAGQTPLDALGVGANDAAAYGTGTVVHADALQQGSHAPIDLDVLLLALEGCFDGLRVGSPGHATCRKHR